MLHPNLEQHWKQKKTNGELSITFIRNKHHTEKGGRYSSLGTDCFKSAFSLLGAEACYQTCL